MSKSFWIGILGTMAVVSCVVLFFGGASQAAVEPACYTNPSQEYVVSQEPYMDIVSNVVHPPTMKAGNERYEMMVLGAGSSDYYSIAMYIDPSHGRMELEEFKGRSSSELRTQTGNMQSKRFSVPFYNKVAHASSDKAMRLVITEPIEKEAMINNLIEMMKPRLGKEGADPATQAELLNSFESMMTLGEDKEFSKNDELIFSVTNGDFGVSLNGEQQTETIDNDAFEAAFFNVWVDEQTAHLDAKERFADRAPLMWSRGEYDLKIAEGDLKAVDVAHPESVAMFYGGKQTNMALGGKTTSPDNTMDVSLYVDYKFFTDVSRDSAVVSQLLGRSMTRALRFSMVTDVVTSVFINQLVSAMDPTLEEEIEDKQAITKAKTNLRNGFPFEFSKGDTFYLACDHKSDQLACQLDGAAGSSEVAVVTESSKQLCKALFTAYLGESSILGEGRKDLVAFIQPGQVAPPAPVIPETDDKEVGYPSSVDSEDYEAQRALGTEVPADWSIWGIAVFMAFCALALGTTGTTSPADAADITANIARVNAANEAAEVSWGAEVWTWF